MSRLHRKQWAAQIKNLIKETCLSHKPDRAPKAVKVASARDADQAGQGRRRLLQLLHLLLRLPTRFLLSLPHLSFLALRRCYLRFNVFHRNFRRFRL